MIGQFARLAAVLFGAVCTTLPAGELPEPLPLKFEDSKWQLGKYASIKDGILTVEVPDTPEKDGQNFATYPLDLTPLRNQSISVTVNTKGTDISIPAQNWNGGKVMLYYRDENGMDHWHHPTRLTGSFDWRDFGFSAPITAGATKGLLHLGLQQSSGKIEFKLDSIKAYTLFPRVNEDYKITYPDRIRNTAPMRGVMSPHSFTEDDFKTLKEWNVNLVRAQITRDWGKAGTDRDLAEYDKWLNGKLDHLEEALKLAEKYGVKMVIDLHSPPGGRSTERDMNMFYEKEYADHFVECWKRIAQRFKGNPAVWAYDLVNEPVQNRPAKYDYWNLPRMAAEAAREIDPATPIIIESNEWDAPASYSYLSPLAMDNVIYQVHMYAPGTFTHQGVNNTFGEQGKGAGVTYPGFIEGKQWNKETIRQTLQPVRDFQLRHNARIYVGEFSAIAWAPGAAKYLADCIEVFEEYGWDWTYHAFREWNGWSVEHEGADAGSLKPSADNDRKQTLLKAFQKNSR